MRRPLIPIALLYLAGILLAGIPVQLYALFFAAFDVVLLFILWPKARIPALGALILLAGWINLAQRRAILSPNDLRILAGSTEQIAKVRGFLRDTPSHRVRFDKQKQTNVWSSVAEIEVREIQFKDQPWRPAFGRVVTTTPGVLPDSIFGGQSVEVDGDIRPARGPIAPGLFDYREFLRQKGIYYQLPVHSADAWRVLSSPRSPPIADRFTAWARKTLALGLPVEDQSLQLEWALTLGWKTAMTDEVTEPFIRAATYHIFAVDGLRIAIITAILFGLLRALGVRRAAAGLVAIPFIWFYAAMTDWPASAIRAIIMAMVIFIGWSLKRPSDPINSLFAAAIIILVWEPRQLFQAGFQLSFFVVLCIILIMPFFIAIGQHVLKPDPLLPDNLQPRWKARVRTPVHFVLDIFLTSMAAWLGSIPLVAWYFHLITPLSGPANVPAIPLCGLVLTADLSSLLFGAWLPSVSQLFNCAGWGCMELIRDSSEWSAQLPGAYYYVPMPGAFSIALYYFLLIALLTGWLFKGDYRRWKIASAISLSFLWVCLWLWERPTTQLTVLPLNGGHAIYLDSPGHNNEWLVDCGSAPSADSTVKDYLRAQGVNRLPNFILTHGESFYSGGAQTVHDLFRPQSIYTGGHNFLSPDYRKFLDGLIGDPALKSALQFGDAIGPFTVLYPGRNDNFGRADDNALVLRAEIRGLRILFCSDLGHAGQVALLNHIPNTNDLRADIVVAGVPEQDEPLNDALLDAIQPRIIVIADAAYPAPRQANSALRQRLASRRVPVIYTRDSGAVTLRIRPGRWKLSAMDDSHFSGVLPR
jgi:competence protein ComEC